MDLTGDQVLEEKNLLLRIELPFTGDQSVALSLNWVVSPSPDCFLMDLGRTQHTSWECLTHTLYMLQWNPAYYDQPYHLTRMCRIKQDKGLRHCYWKPEQSTMTTPSGHNVKNNATECVNIQLLTTSRHPTPCSVHRNN